MFLSIRFSRLRVQKIVETKDQTAEEVLFNMHLKLSEMDAQYEMSGKNIDEDS